MARVRIPVGHHDIISSLLMVSAWEGLVAAVHSLRLSDPRHCRQPYALRDSHDRLLFLSRRKGEG